MSIGNRWRIVVDDSKVEYERYASRIDGRGNPRQTVAIDSRSIVPRRAGDFGSTTG